MPSSAQGMSLKSWFICEKKPQWLTSVWGWDKAAALDGADLDIIHWTQTQPQFCPPAQFPTWRQLIKDKNNFNISTYSLVDWTDRDPWLDFINTTGSGQLMAMSHQGLHLIYHLCAIRILRLLEVLFPRTQQLPWAVQPSCKNLSGCSRSYHNQKGWIK